MLAPSLTLSAGGDSIETAVPEGGKLQVTATLHNGALTQDLVVPVSVKPISASGPTDAAADYSALPTVTIHRHHRRPRRRRRRDFHRRAGHPARRLPSTRRRHNRHHHQ